MLRKLRFLCEQSRAGVSAWLAKEIPGSNKYYEVHCKSGSKSARLGFATEAKCQKFVAQYSDGGFQYADYSPSCLQTAFILVRQPKSKEFRDIGGRFAPLWKVLDARVRAVFFCHDDIFPTVDVLSQTLKLADRKMESVSPQCSNPLLLATSSYSPSSPKHLYYVCQSMFGIHLLAKPLLKPGTPQTPGMPLCDGCPFASSPFFRVAGRGGRCTYHSTSG